MMNESRGPSRYPHAVDPSLVGNYPAGVSSGGGYFWDEVLEYRVWLHPELGAEDLFEGNDYFQSFVTFEEADRFSTHAEGAEEPLVLIRQREHVNEAKPGVYIHEKADRLTEWDPQWLKGSKRGPHSISEFLARGGR